VPNFQTMIFGVFEAIAFAMVVLAYSTPIYIIKFILAIFALLFSVLGFSMRYYYYIIVPFIHAKNKSIILNNSEAFFVAPNGNAIFNEENGIVSATVFVRIPVYSSSTEMSDEEKYDFSNLFSKIVSLSKTPIKISTQLRILNKDDFINKIKDKLNEAENRYNEILSKKDSKPEEVERAKGEVTMWHNLIDSISKIDSFSAISYVAVTAKGGSQEEAINMALQKANEVAAGINSTYGVIADIITTPEIFTLLEPEYIIPYSSISRQISGMV